MTRSSDDVMARLRAANPVPDEEVHGVARSREARRLLTQIVGADPGAKRTPHQRRPRRLLAAMTAAAAIAAALGVGIGVLRPFGSGASAEAAEILRRAADRASAEANASDGRFRYTKSESAYPNVIVASESSTYTALVPSVREIWIAPDGSGRLVERPGDPIFFSEEDRRAWERDHPDGADPTSEVFGPDGLYYADLESLPTDPDDLEDVVRERAEQSDVPTNVEMFVVIGDIMRETVPPPELRSALFEVAARIDGVEVLGEVTDGTGRPGIAVGMETDHSGALERREMIFDPESYEFLGEQETLLERADWLDAEPPVRIGYAAYLEWGYVDSVRERP